MALIGITEPRLFTQPLRELTAETSRGYEVIEFAGALGIDLMPWQRWFLIHALELKPDGTYRFRTVLLLISRQNGKTTLGQLLALWFMRESDKVQVLGMSTNLQEARESWLEAVDLAQDGMADYVSSVKFGALDTSLRLTNGSRYAICAANRRGPRGKSIDLLLLDELREHRDHEAWAAANATTTARPNPLAVCMSNQGDDGSVVLNGLRDSALAGSDALGLFEWSAEDGCDLDDREQWRQANPALGYTITEQTLEALLASSPPAVFRTEHLCQRVQVMDTAIDLAAWRELADVGTMDGLRERVAVCLDVSLDMEHVTLVAAAVTDTGHVRTEVVAAWDSTSAARAELPVWLDKIKPRAFGWFPNGPAAGVAADLRGVANAQAITDVAAACMGLAEQVTARRVLHSNDPLIAAQLAQATRMKVGDGWRFARRGGVGQVDAVYALAGAVHLARTLPAPRAPLVVL